MDNTDFLVLELLRLVSSYYLPTDEEDWAEVAEVVKALFNTLFPSVEISSGDIISLDGFQIVG